MVTKEEIQKISKLLASGGFFYAGTCNCSSRARKYKKGRWQINVFRQGFARLYFNSKIQGNVNFEGDWKKITELVQAAAV